MTTETQTIEFIHVYTRAEALADGVLRDISDEARKHGFRYQLAITPGCYAEIVERYSRGTGQAEAERLGDILDILRLTILHAPMRLNRMIMTIATKDGDGVTHMVDVLVVCGPGDEGEPVLTILLPGEE